MNILIFSHEFPPQVGGAGVVAEEYASCLAEVGHEVTVLTQYRKDSSYSSTYKVIQVKTVKKLWFLSYRNAVEFSRFDLIILNDIGAAYTAGLFFDSACLYKSIMLLHGSEPEIIFLKPTIQLRITCFKGVYRRALDNVAGIIAVSHFMKSKFLNYTKFDYLAKKISVLPNFINHDIFYPKPDPLFKVSLGIPCDAFLLLTASRVVFEKGYLEKISIFERLVSISDKSFYWLIVGDGNDLLEIKNEVEARHLSDRVFFLGSIPRNNLASIYSNVDVFWMLSNFEESLGLVYIEAQACGCPVMARNAAGAREAILDNKTGYLVNTEDEAFLLLMKDVFLRLNKSEIVEFAQGFHSGLLVRYIDKIYSRKNVISNSHP